MSYTRQAYYERLKYKQTRVLESDIILMPARAVRVDFPRKGGGRLRIYLRPKFEAMGISIGCDAYAALLAENRMLVYRPRSKRKTTFSCHRFHKYPNLIRDYTPSATNRLWVSDITYIGIGYGFVYLALITNACSRKIVGWDLSRDLSSAGALRALQMALRSLPEGHSLIHHSDRGVQYCHQVYIEELNKRNILISMTESGDPLENALSERVNGILKTEWLDKRPLRNWSEAQAYVEQIIGLYNSLKPHQSLSFLTPMVHCSGIVTQRKWKNYPSQSKGVEAFVPLSAGSQNIFCNVKPLARTGKESFSEVVVFTGYPVCQNRFSSNPEFSLASLEISSAKTGF